uniref:Halobacterial output domain-containing protein n=1 Tax=Haloterrigena alkaliphila TaxID=2816475 RepID=A0A8A2VLE5_9EURY
MQSESLHEPDELLEAVVNTVADAEGVSPLELQPLASVIDPDTFDTLFPSETGDVTLEFEYQGYRVRISGDTRVTVEVSHG